MRTECINHQYAFDKPMPVTRLMDHVSNSTKIYLIKNLFLFSITFSECQVPTQRYGRRPFGVGFLMAGFDVCLMKYYLTKLLQFLLFHRKKVHIYINYVHQLITIHANQWLLVHVLNQLEHILKKI